MMMMMMVIIIIIIIIIIMVVLAACLKQNTVSLFQILQKADPSNVEKFAT
jgi:hypothetical protein